MIRELPQHAEMYQSIRKVEHHWYSPSWWGINDGVHGGRTQTSHIFFRSGSRTLRLKVKLEYNLQGLPLGHHVSHGA